MRTYVVQLQFYPSHPLVILSRMLDVNRALRVFPVRDLLCRDLGLYLAVSTTDKEDVSAEEKEEDPVKKVPIRSREVPADDREVTENDKPITSKEDPYK